MKAWKHVVILGAGESGVGAALLAQKQGLRAFVSDAKRIAEAYRNELTAQGIDFEESGHRFERIQAADVVIKSPGVPGNAAILDQVRGRGIPIISEIEFASRFCSGKILAITGSNGKTTTTELTHFLLRQGRRSVAMGGNVGKSFARLLCEDQKDLYVIEISSFQLDDVRDFKPHIAMILNITPDHLDRYDYQMDRYAEAKFKIAKKQDADDVLIVNASDRHIAEWMGRKKWKQRVIRIDEKRATYNTLTTVEGRIIDMKQAFLKGRHNMLNSLFAATAVRLVGLDDDVIRRALPAFKTVVHRLETVAFIDGIEYINDSKATNVDAVYYALDAMDKPVIWIAGGTDKGNAYETLFDLARSKVRALICLGFDNDKLIEAFEPHIKNVEETTQVETAIRLARQYADRGDVVLLSPACASFDLFKNYQDRGVQFKKAVWNLLNEPETKK